MKQKLKIAICVLIAGITAFTSCRKQSSPAAPLPVKHSPIANAGPDQFFLFPPPTVITLDGSASTDPDGGALTYQWSRISGPVSIWIANNSTGTTEIRSVILGLQIEIGIYEFELKVTNANGMSSTDKVTITVTNEINVANIAQLYAAVNDTANKGSKVILAPGTYTLSSTFPKGGRLEFQTYMEIQGQKDHPELVMIDESALPAASFNLPSAGRSGGIRMGAGTNRLQWLTVKGGSSSANPLSVIDTDINSTETSIVISHINILGNGSSIGIDIRSRRVEQAGRKIDATLTNNDITGVTTSLGPAVEIQNANGASGSFIHVSLAENYFHGNRTGIGTFNNAATATVNDSRIEVTSSADRIEGNGVGLYVGGGISQVSNATANRNTTTLNFLGTFIRNNNPLPMPPELRVDVGAAFTTCGIYSFGGLSTTNNGTNLTSDNKLQLSFSGCEITNNNSPDINVYGAWCPSQALLAGTNNLVEIYLNGISANVVDIPSVPVEPGGTNVVNVYH